MSLPLDYYAVLDIRRDATDLQIKQAYRRLALQWHPDKNKGSEPEEATAQFALISEAFDVLTDPERRAIFDYYGEKGLKAGVKTQTGDVSVPYVLSSTPSALFDSVFGTTSPFAALFSYNTSDAVSSSPPPVKPPCQELKLFLSLEEIYRGCTKKVKVARKRLSLPAAATSPSSAASPPSFLIDERLLSVDVRPGWKAGTRITFPGEGDESDAAVKGDVAFVLCDRPHPRFRRQGSDLLYLQRLRLVDALCGLVVQVEMLDDRRISVGLTDVCSPKGRKVVSGEGMVAPETGQAGQQAAKGDLIFEYEIEFPEQLSLQQKEALRKILP